MHIHTRTQLNLCPLCCTSAHAAGVSSAKREVDILRAAVDWDIVKTTTTLAVPRLRMRKPRGLPVICTRDIGRSFKKRGSKIEAQCTLILLLQRRASDVLSCFYFSFLQGKDGMANTAVATTTLSTHGVCTAADREKQPDSAVSYGPLTPKQKDLVEQTWKFVEGDLQGAGILLFKRWVLYLHVQRLCWKYNIHHFHVQDIRDSAWSCAVIFQV